MLEIFLRLLLGVVEGLLLGVVAGLSARFPWVEKSLHRLQTAIMFFAAGVLIGWLSVWLFPEPFIRPSSLHGINLVITPTVAGLTMAAIAWLRLRQSQLMVQLESFSFGFIFAFGLVLMRLLFMT